VQPDGDVETQGETGDAGGDRRDGRYGWPTDATDDQLLADPVAGRSTGELITGLRVRHRRHRHRRLRRSHLRVPGEADRTVRVQIPSEYGPFGQRPRRDDHVCRPAAPEPVAQTAARRRARTVRLVNGGTTEDHWEPVVQARRITRRKVRGGSDRTIIIDDGQPDYPVV